MGGSGKSFSISFSFSFSFSFAFSSVDFGFDFGLEKLNNRLKIEVRRVMVCFSVSCLASFWGLLSF
jgi:hypothetical protein